MAGAVDMSLEIVDAEVRANRAVWEAASQKYVREYDAFLAQAASGASFSSTERAGLALGGGSLIRVDGRARVAGFGALAGQGRVARMFSNPRRTAPAALPGADSPFAQRNEGTTQASKPVASFL